MKNNGKWIALVCAILMSTVMLASCKGTESSSPAESSSQNENSSIDTTVDGASGETTDTTVSEEGQPTNSGNTSSSQGQKTNSSGTKAPSSSSTSKNVTGKVLYIKDFGAKGDGKTDDAEAIMIALGKLQESGEGSTLVFESNKTYYAKNNGTSMKSIITLGDGKNLTIKGSNTTLLIDSSRFYVQINDTTNVTLQGFNFDYKTKPAFRATGVSVDAANSKAVMIADRDIGLENGEEYIPSMNDWFGVLDKPDGRYHMYIKKYKMIDKAARKFEVYFDSGDSLTRGRVSMLTSVALTAPMPFVGHFIERAFSLTGNTNFTMKDCNIYAMSRFGFAIFRSEGTMRFTNVNIVRAPNALDQKLNFVGWRDGFHCKENRAKIIWDNCKVEGLYDDVFNISASTMYVKEVNSTKDEINMYWPETGGTYAPLKSGDKLTVINTKTGELVGTTTVKRVMTQSGSTNRIKLTNALSKLTTGTNVLVFFDSMVAPGSEIKNSTLDGTFRFRGPLTVTNTSFNNRRMWIDIFGATEGPVPQNILFKNCQFTTDSSTGVYFHITSSNTSTAAGAYHLKNIVFDGCKINKINVEIGRGDDVRFINSK